MTLAESRLQLGAAAVLSPSRAAELLPWSEAAALRWLEERGLIRVVRGVGRAVIWGDVVAAIQTGDEPAAPAAPTRRATLPRSTRV